MILEIEEIVCNGKKVTIFDDILALRFFTIDIDTVGGLLNIDNKALINMQVGSLIFLILLIHNKNVRNTIHTIWPQEIGYCCKICAYTKLLFLNAFFLWIERLASCQTLTIITVH